MRIATIDIGTNTILLLVADIGTDGSLTPILDEQVVARVGKGVDKSGAIAWDAFTRSEKYLASFVERAKEHGAELIRATGTSALRDAHNGDDYLDYMHEKLGLEIEILSGEDEALWTYGGAISGFPDRSGSFAVLDIGGGSTELTVGEGFHILDRKSVDIGCVRLTEKYLHHTPPTDEEIAAMTARIDEAIESYPSFSAGETHFVGVAGTVTTLAGVELGLKEYDGAAISGFRLTRAMIQQRFDEFRKLTRDELQHAMHIDPGRADIILVGIGILKRLTEKRDLDGITVSERGLRYGIAMREWERGFENSSHS
ncbi:Ppx/GppA family phosphatase [bacterium]|nr:Ppx/GppA family phosphatase [bacterium]